MTKREIYFKNVLSERVLSGPLGLLITTHAFGIMMSFRCDKITVHDQ